MFIIRIGFFVIYSSIIFWANADESSDYELLMVQVMFRHGDRTPQYREIPDSDPDKHSSVYRPYGQLTDVGKQREYRLGQYLRERYDGFLSKTFNPIEVFARSTAVDRTIESTLLVLAGLFPVFGEVLDSNWNSSINWTPIPTYNVPGFIDNLFHLKHCSAYKKELHRSLPSFGMKKRLANYSEFIDFVYNKTGVPHQGLSLLHFFLEAKESLKLPLPDWYDEKAKEILKAIQNIFYDRATSTDELKLFAGGPIPYYFIENERKENRGKKTKIYLLGGHDSNIAFTLRALGVTDHVSYFPNYASALMIEKYKKGKHRFVRVLFYTGTTEKTLLIKIGDCDEYCSMSDFEKHLESVTPSDDQMQCLIQEINKEKTYKIE